MTTLRPLAFAALLLSLAAPVAVRAQDAPAANPSQSGAAGAPGQGMRGPGRMGRGIRGTVVSASGANVAIKTEAGENWTVITTDNTRVMIDNQPVKLAEIKAGDEVMAAGVLDQDKHEAHAMMVMGVSAARAAKIKADMGKTYIVGKITAINETKLTIERPDKVSQTILLDESTSLKRGGRLPAEAMGGLFGGAGMGGGPRGPRPAGEAPNNANSGGMPPGMEGESITLADVKVGDNIAATGSLKGGTFVPADLHVLQARGGRNGGAVTLGTPRP